eukprot:scaffold25018_cov99-Isochrysis_galbana.AAC.1
MDTPSRCPRLSTPIALLLSHGFATLVLSTARTRHYEKFLMYGREQYLNKLSVPVWNSSKDQCADLTLFTNQVRTRAKCFFASVTPEELSAPDSYSGSPTSYSGAENTEELSTPDGLPSRIAIDCLFKKLFRDNRGAIVLPDSSSEVSDSPVALRGPASAGRRSSSRTFWWVMRACKARSRLRQRRTM